MSESWKIEFRASLSHILLVYTWCFTWLWICFRTTLTHFENSINILHLIVCQTRSILWDVLRWSRAGTWRLSFFYYAFAVLLCIALSGILGQYAHWAIEVYIYVSWLTRVSFFVIMSDNSCCFCWNGFIVYTYILLQTLANALTGAVVFWILACHACLYVEYVTCKVRFLETFGNVYIG